MARYMHTDSASGVLVLSVLDKDEDRLVVRITSSLRNEEPVVRAVTSVEEVLAEVRKFLEEVSS
jgi:hypothetical protein